MQPIFVTGIGRSGTSALLKSLVFHEEILEPEILGEAPFIGHFINFIHKYEHHPDREYRLKNYKIDQAERAELFGNMIYKLHIAPKNKEDLKRPELKYWPAKAFPGKGNLKTFRAVFPGMKVFYIIRNGIEVVNSTRNFHGFKGLSFEDCCRRWAESIQVNHFLEGDDDVAFIKHHEMVTQPSDVFAAAFDRLGMNQHSGPADYIANNIFNSSFDEREENIDVHKLFEKRMQAAWDKWTTEEQEIFRKLCDQYMKKYGFVLPDGYSKPRTGKPERLASPPVKYKARPKAAAVTVSTDTKPASEGPKFAVSPVSLTKTPSAKVLKTLKNRPKPTGSLDEKTAFYMPANIVNYSLHTSFKNNFTYFEVPKVGCTTIKFLLQSLEYLTGDGIPNDRKKVGSYVHYRNQSPLVMYSKMSNEEKRAVMSGRKMFRFSFVRDPYSRILSCYKSKIEKSLGPKKHLLALRDGVSVDEVDLKSYMSFREFLELVSTQRPYDMDIHWRPQVDQMMIDFVKYDFIGRYENFSADLNHIMNLLTPPNISLDIPPARNATSAREELSDFYDIHCRKLVAEIYESDFTCFNYEI